MLNTIHPFPARMASELALKSLTGIRKGSVVLDPMMGSGTVLRQAISLGHNAVGFDTDPLAVLMSKVWTTSVCPKQVSLEMSRVVKEAKALDLRRINLPWIDRDEETRKFVSYWFGLRQRRDLRRLAFVLHERSRHRFSHGRLASLDVLRLCLSRIIVTKDRGASLGRDISHSRPHRVATSSNYDVFSGFERAVRQVLSKLSTSGESETGMAVVLRGDARRIDLPDDSVDVVITSPPYLNAIDYLRGHRLALIWLGFTLPYLRSIRSHSIGAERYPDYESESETILQIMNEMCDREALSSRSAAVIARYSGDLLRMCREIARVIKVDGRATFVIGNSCLRNVFVRNSSGLVRCATLSGLSMISELERELPVRNRYLPVSETGSLSKRMRTETVLTFIKKKVSARPGNNKAGEKGIEVTKRR